MRSRSPATSPTRTPPISPRPRARVPEERLLVETDAPYLTPQAVRKQRNQPAFVAHTAAFLAELRGVARRGAGRDASSATPRACSAGDDAGGHVSAWPTPVQPSLRRLRAVRRPPRPRARAELPDRLEHPRRDRPRGRARAARTWCSRSAAAWACSPSTSPSASRTCTWSRSTSACARRCCDATDPHANVTVHWADAMTIDLRALRPQPTKVVANLPYGIAAGVLLRTIEELAERRAAGWRWCSARSASGWRRRPGSGAYGVPVGARAAGVRGARCCARSRAPCSTRCRTSTRCSCGMRRRARTRRERAAPRAARARRRRASPTGARRWPARSRCPGGVGGRSREQVRAALERSAIPPTCAPSACRPRTSARSRGCSSYERRRRLPRASARALAPGEGQPRAVPRADARRGRQARAGDASCSRSRWPTS